MIILAKLKDFKDIMSFYDEVIDGFQNKKHKPGWKKGIYPHPEDIKYAVKHKQIYMYIKDDKIISCMIVNKSCNEEYQEVSFQYDSYLVIHALGVHPDYLGHGYAKDMVKFVIKLAQDNYIPSVRLDVLKGNTPAKHLYESLGFHHIQDIQMYYEDTGWTDFHIYEYYVERYAYYDSPIGIIKIVENNEGITSITFVDKEESSMKGLYLKDTIIQLDEYFHHKRKMFSIPLSLSGTDLQLKVWKTLQTIPYGDTSSYKHIASLLDKPNSSRGIAHIIGQNPILILIPCHRIIKSDGSLSGYSGGIKRKEALLELETH